MNALARAISVSCAVSLASALAGCGGEPPPPAPTVASAEPIRGSFEIARGGAAKTVVGPLRVERGATARTGADGRGALRMDTGAWVLFDRGAEATVELGKLTLARGRTWIDATSADETTVATPQGTLTTTGAALAVDLNANATTVYCAAGEITYRTPRGNGRLEQGETVKLTGSAAPAVQPEALWDDWTGGLADPTPRADRGTSAIGILTGRRLDERGVARTALAVRGHEVKANVRGDLAVTEIVQTFFNARSDVLEAEYSIRLPKDAIVQSFAVDLGSGFVEAAVSPFATQQGYELVWADPSVSMSSLSYAGPGRLRARVFPVTAGASVRIKLRYTEWLARHGNMRTYVYPMGAGGEPPLLGEFVLEVDTNKAQAGALRAGMGARTEHGKVVLRRSDFRPRADFYLDLVDTVPAATDVADAHVVSFTPPPGFVTADGTEQYVFFDVPTERFEAETAQREPLDLVLVVDVSGAIEPDQLELSRSIVESVLRQLAPTDRVALLLGDVTGHAPAGARAALAPATDPTREALLESMSRADLGGATDLAKMLRDAAQLVAGKPRGAVLYLGDGMPTTGALDATALRASLATIDSPPRFFALAVGDDANLDLLHSLFGDQAIQVHQRTEASRAAMRVLAEAARPTLRGLTVDLGPTVERVYPRGPITLPVGEHVRLVGRLRGDLPKQIRVRARRDATRVDETYKLESDHPTDDGDIRKRWASARLSELLDNDAGREALAELGVRFSIVTPWTSLVVGVAPGTTVSPIRDFDVDPLTVAWGLGGGGNAVLQETLDGGSGWRRRARSVTEEPAATVESTWVSRVDDSVAPDAAPGVSVGTTTDGAGRGAPSDGGLAHAAVERAMREGERGPRGCYERKLNVRPDLSGDVMVRVDVDGTGAVSRAELTQSTLGDSDVDACVLTEVRGLRFPATGGAGTVTVTYGYQFTMPTRPIGVRQQCSDASRQPVDVRSNLWRERLVANAGVQGALSVWREALQQCELGDWRARRTLLDRMLRSVGSVREQIQLYQALRSEPSIASYLRRAILRNVRTPQDVIAVRNGLGLEAPVDWSVFQRLWRAAATPAVRLALVRRWLEVAPDEMDLRIRLLALLEELSKIPEARRLARELRADPLADAKVRTAIGEFWLRQNDELEARRVFSEIVEHAPLDPWARRRLGDLYRAHGWADDAYREYGTLAKLRSNDDAVLLLLALAAADAGRIDEALRLEQRLSESTDDEVDIDAAGVARLWTTVRLARLKADQRLSALAGDIRARERETGALRDPPAVFAALTWSHPDDTPELFVRYPSTPEDVGWERAPLLGSGFGLEAVRVREREPGDYLFEVRRTERDALRDVEAQLLVVSIADSGERIEQMPVRLTRTARTLRWKLAPDGSLVSVPVPATPTPARATAR